MLRKLTDAFEAPGHHRVLGLSVAAAALLADQASKWLLLYDYGFKDMSPFQAVPVLPFLNLVMVWNPGVSYGLFAARSALATWVLVGVAIAAICALFWWLWTTTSRTVALGTGFVIGGAIGNNLIDRVVYGRVADFFHLFAFGHSWYVFNIADVAICVGAAVLVYEMIKPHPIPAPSFPPKP